jgi:hypothetical protein
MALASVVTKTELDDQAMQDSRLYDKNTRWLLKTQGFNNYDLRRLRVVFNLVDWDHSGNIDCVELFGRRMFRSCMVHPAHASSFIAVL